MDTTTIKKEITEFNIFVLYEINKDSNENRWEYSDMPGYIEWVGKGSTIPFEKDVSSKWIKRETQYPREEQFFSKIEFYEETKEYLNIFFNNLLDKKIINRFILNNTSKPPDT